MGFWKDVSMEMATGKSKDAAIHATVEYYKKYKPQYFNHNEKEKAKIDHILSAR